MKWNLFSFLSFFFCFFFPKPWKWILKSCIKLIENRETLSAKPVISHLKATVLCSHPHLHWQSFTGEGGEWGWGRQLQRYKRLRNCIQWSTGFIRINLQRKNYTWTKKLAAAHLSLHGYYTVNAGKKLDRREQKEIKAGKKDHLSASGWVLQLVD